jgi:hypothetical protein
LLRSEFLKRTLHFIVGRLLSPPPASVAEDTSNRMGHGE